MKLKTKMLAFSVILAASYIVLGLVFQSVSFGPIQVRVADSLYPLIAVFGLPALLGTFFGHFIFNLYGFSTGLSLGVLDMLSPFIFLIAKYAIYKWKFKAIPIHVFFVVFWVSYLLTFFGVPYWFSVVTVGVGEIIAELVIGVPLALAIKKRLMVKDFGYLKADNQLKFSVEGEKKLEAK